MEHLALFFLSFFPYFRSLHFAHHHLYHHHHHHHHHQETRECSHQLAIMPNEKMLLGHTRKNALQHTFFFSPAGSSLTLITHCMNYTLSTLFFLSLCDNRTTRQRPLNIIRCNRDLDLCEYLVVLDPIDKVSFVTIVLSPLSSTHQPFLLFPINFVFFPWSAHAA
ncbi:MAG: hypothetical protein J3R72DRAFT_255958 [Linnemannia gamsii]|nr:MAG: hypothetical protein J3R72DRAFT_255958 [Linnemannia gamsii]